MYLFPTGYSSIVGVYKLSKYVVGEFFSVVVFETPIIFDGILYICHPTHVMGDIVDSKHIL